ncbi:MAG: hypothetical protein JW857_12135 [Bacteroidales bacterium]|nr:hypothetical protein [Bacteroidales bacterium]
MKRKFIAFALLLSGLLMGGCAKAPQAEIDATNAAIENAQLAEANIYLPEAFAALQDSMNVINVAIETQKSKMFGSYTAIKEKLGLVQAKAIEVENNSIAKKEQLTNEVNDLYTQLLAMAAENNELVNKAPKGKEGKAAIEAIKSELSVIETEVSALPQLLESGNILDAHAKALAAEEKAQSINSELKAVIEKYSQKRK